MTNGMVQQSTPMYIKQYNESLAKNESEAVMILLPFSFLCFPWDVAVWHKSEKARRVRPLLSGLSGHSFAPTTATQYWFRSGRGIHLLDRLTNVKCQLVLQGHTKLFWHILQRQSRKSIGMVIIERRRNGIHPSNQHQHDHCPPSVGRNELSTRMFVTLW